MDNIDLMILSIFKRYLNWINNNSLDDNIDNFVYYFHQIGKIDFK